MASSNQLVPRIAGPSPSRFSGPLLEYLQSVAQAINRIPNLSITSQSNPNSNNTGFVGDMLVNLTSSNTSTHWWGLTGAWTPSNFTSQGWQPFVMGPIPTLSSMSSKIGAFVVQGSASSFTVVTWSSVKTGDWVSVSPIGSAAASSVSSGLVPWSHCTASGRVEFRLSNVSTLAQNQSAQSWLFVRFTPLADS